jgi:hypothetical protein
LITPSGTGLWIPPTSDPKITGYIWLNLLATGATGMQTYKSFVRSP